MQPVSLLSRFQHKFPNKQNSIEYDSDIIIIPYHRNYSVARKKKEKDPFTLPQPRKKSQTNVTRKQSKQDNSQGLNCGIN